MPLGSCLYKTRSCARGSNLRAEQGSDKRSGSPSLPPDYFPSPLITDYFPPSLITDYFPPIPCLLLPPDFDWLQRRAMLGYACGQSGHPAPAHSLAHIDRNRGTSLRRRNRNSSASGAEFRSSAPRCGSSGRERVWFVACESPRRVERHLLPLSFHRLRNRLARLRPL